MIGMDPGGSTGLGEALDYPAEVTESIARLGLLVRLDLSADPRLVGTPASAEALTQPMLTWTLAVVMLPPCPLPTLREGYALVQAF